MANALNWMTLVSLVVVLVCAKIIISKFIRYFDIKKKVIMNQENNSQDIRILEAKLSEIKLKNKGHDLNENIGYIFNDEGVFFSMEWGEIIGPNDNL